MSNSQSKKSGKKPKLKKYCDPSLFRSYDLTIRNAKDLKRLPVINSMQFCDAWREWDANQSGENEEQSVVMEHQMASYRDVNFKYWVQTIQEMRKNHIMHLATENDCLEAIEYKAIENLINWLENHQSILEYIPYKIFSPQNQAR